MAAATINAANQHTADVASSLRMVQCSSANRDASSRVRFDEWNEVRISGIRTDRQSRKSRALFRVPNRKVRQRQIDVTLKACRSKMKFWLGQRALTIIGNVQ